MPDFSYKARGPNGDLVEGVLDGASAQAVAAHLASAGATPLEITAKQTAELGGSIGDWWARLNTAAPETTDLILFSRQMYTLMRAGVPISQAMSGLIRSTRNVALVEALKDVQASLESGNELSSGLARHPRVFSTLFVAMVRIGENTGRLDAAFLQISEYLERDKDTRARVKAALRYPAFVIIAMALAISIINIFVIPAFAQVFERAQVALPLPTRVLIGTSNFFVAYWMLMLIAVIVAIVGVRLFLQTQAGELFWDRLKISLPLVGDIVYRATLGRFARAFAMSLSAGVPLVQALTVVSKAVDNEYVGGKILDIRTGIERGETLTRTAAGTEMFSPLVIQMLDVGEDTGAIDDLMLEVAGFYEREVDYDIKNLSSTIEPVLILLIGGLVLLLALGVFLPMWDLASVKLT